ncbi:MAG: energy transducer TonB [Ignavibacteriaceae bacterium]
MEKYIQGNMMKKNTLLIFLFVSLTAILASSKAYSQQDPYLPFAQVMPQPVGGIASIYKHIKYPEMAKNAGVEGKVYLLIYIDENGRVNDVKVLKGIGGGCDEAAINGIKEVKFIPGKQNGVPVKVKLSLPVDFKLN